MPSHTKAERRRRRNAARGKAVPLLTTTPKVLLGQEGQEGREGFTGRGPTGGAGKKFSPGQAAKDLTLSLVTQVDELASLETELADATTEAGRVSLRTRIRQLNRDVSSLKKQVTLSGFKEGLTPKLKQELFGEVPRAESAAGRQQQESRETFEEDVAEQSIIEAAAGASATEEDVAAAARLRRRRGRSQFVGATVKSRLGLANVGGRFAFLGLS